jgi:hypothetical protein
VIKPILTGSWAFEGTASAANSAIPQTTFLASGPQVATFRTNET